MHKRLPFIILLYLCVSCTSRSVSLESIGGHVFSFNTPISSVMKVGRDGPDRQAGGKDSLVLGTGSGQIMILDLRDGLIHPLYNDPQQRLIYEVLYDDQKHFLYAARNGGLIRISEREDGTTDTTTLRIEGKGHQFSAYKSIRYGKGLISATSNGMTYWEDLAAPEEAAGFLDGSPGNAENRYYDVGADSTGGIFFSGEKGLFRRKDTHAEKVALSGQAFNAVSQVSPDSYYALAPDGGFFLVRKKAGGPETGWERIEKARFPSCPTDFKICGNVVYALSATALEVLDLGSKDKTPVTVRLPEQRLSRKRNRARRSILVENKGFLYAAPGGANLYRIPLFPWSKSEEVIQILPDGKDWHVFTADKRLYTKKGRFVRTFGDSLNPVGIKDGSLLALNNGREYVVFSGNTFAHRRKAGRTASSDVLWHLFRDGKSFEGALDQIGVFPVGKNWRFGAELTRLPDMEDDLHRHLDSIGKSDYYAVGAAFLGDGLAIATLNDGIYLHKDRGFVKVLDKSRYNLVRDIKAVPSGESVCILTDDAVWRLTEKGAVPMPFGKEKPLLEHLNRILPDSDTTFYAFTDYYVYTPGLYKFAVRGNTLAKIKEEDPTKVINCAILVDGQPYFGGDAGVRLPDGKWREIRSGAFRRFLAPRFPLRPGLILAALAVLILLIYLIFRQFERIKVRTQKKRIIAKVHKKRMDLAEWSRTNGLGGYTSLILDIMEKNVMEDVTPKGERLFNRRIGDFLSRKAELEQLEVIYQVIADVIERLKDEDRRKESPSYSLSEDSCSICQDGQVVAAEFSKAGEADEFKSSFAMDDLSAYQSKQGEQDGWFLMDGQGNKALFRFKGEAPAEQLLDRFNEWKKFQWDDLLAKDIEKASEKIQEAVRELDRILSEKEDEEWKQYKINKYNINKDKNNKSGEIKSEEIKSGERGKTVFFILPPIGHLRTDKDAVAVKTTKIGEALVSKGWGREKTEILKAIKYKDGLEGRTGLVSLIATACVQADENRKKSDSGAAK